MFYADFDGCQYGLKPRSTRSLPEHAKNFHLKPWRFATNIPTLLPAFNKICPGQSNDHKHIAIEGSDAKYTQYYTPYMVLLIHACVAQFVNSGSSNTSPTLLSFGPKGSLAANHLQSLSASRAQVRPGEQEVQMIQAAPCKWRPSSGSRVEAVSSKHRGRASSNPGITKEESTSSERRAGVWFGGP